MTFSSVYHFVTDESFMDMLKLLGGGIGIFLLGMRMMSDGFQSVAGARLNRWMSAITDNRVLAVMTGIGATAIIQSSTATIVTIVGLVNGGVLTLAQAIGVIFGANIGTTLTAWFMTLNFSKYGLLMVGVSAFPYLFSKREKVRNIAVIVLGFGLLFAGLGFMKDGVGHLQEDAKAWFQVLKATDYASVLKCVAVGTMFTMLIQSSTAAIGIVIVLSTAGMIDFTTALALLLGDNLGSALSTMLISLGTSRNARRAACAHAIFNTLGVVWAFSFFFHLVPGVEKITLVVAKAFPNLLTDAQLTGDGFAYPALGIAVAHTVYNVSNTLLFLPFLGWFVAGVRLLIPVRESERMAETAQKKLGFLDRCLLTTPSLAIEQSRKEIIAMGEMNLRMLERLKPILLTEGACDEEVQIIQEGERLLDEAQRDVMEFVSQITARKSSQSIAAEAQRQIRQADEFESISDYLVRLTKSRNRLLKMGVSLSDAAKQEVTSLHSHATTYAEAVVQLLRGRNATLLRKCRDLNKDMLLASKQAHSQLLQRLVEEKVSAAKSVIYSDILVEFRRIKDHLQNIVDTMEE